MNVYNLEFYHDFYHFIIHLIIIWIQNIAVSELTNIENRYIASEITSIFSSLSYSVVSK